ncbi:unnamed protein product [Rotaria sp. Silwood1]|nr:unnamed protein product [Rotaria sp. Silwood1]
MAFSNDSRVIGVLAHGIVEITQPFIDSDHADEKHMEYLPYPDNNFHEIIDNRDKFIIEHIHRRTGQAFVSNVRVHVISIVTKHTVKCSATFIDPYFRKEGYLLEKLNDYHCDHHAFFHTRYYCDLCKCHDGPKWFVIKDSYIVDIQLDTHEVCFPMLVDREFQVLTGIHNTDNDDSIKINNLQRKLAIKCSTAHDCDEWAQHLSNLTEQAKDFVSALRSRFNSYAPVRENQLAYWFINGKSDMEAVVKALLIAKEEVIRHPRYNTKDGLLLWSHHEKMVVIDEKIAFIGGIDLCHGRWDDEHMRLVDLGDKNDTKLKSRFDIVAENVASRDRETVETAQITTVRTAEQAGEISVKIEIKDDEDSDAEKILEEQ